VLKSVIAVGSFGVVLGDGPDGLSAMPGVKGQLIKIHRVIVSASPDCQ
jgi:hypothetical protein